MVEPSELIITKEIAINASPATVWRVLTDPALIARWMNDEELTVISEWREGAAIVMRGLLHGMVFENRGVIRRLLPETTFEYAYWSTLSRAVLPEHPDNYSTVRFDLMPIEVGTLLKLALSDFPEPSIYPHANLYWGGTLPIIKAVCENGDPHAGF